MPDREGRSEGCLDLMQCMCSVFAVQCIALHSCMSAYLVWGRSFPQLHLLRKGLVWLVGYKRAGEKMVIENGDCAH